MDHSMQGYLVRQSTEELKDMLRYYMQKDRFKQCLKYVLEICNILEQRYKEEHQETSPEVLELWEKYLEDYHRSFDERDTNIETP